MTQALKEKADWCEEFFDDLFAEHCLMTRSRDTLDGIVAFLKTALHLKAGDMIFDQCCGVGSLSLALARAGYRTHGVDLIPSYIAQARQEAALTSSACHFAAGDAHAYATPYPCDAAINWWTSFGYTDDDAQNVKMLDRVFTSLKPGGWFALDYMNAAERLAQFSAGGSVLYRQQKENCIIACESRIDGDMLVKDWIYEHQDGSRVEKRGGGAKLYTARDLQALLEKAGFTAIRFHGSVAGEALEGTSPRCIAVAQKPGA